MHTPLPPPATCNHHRTYTHVQMRHYALVVEMRGDAGSMSIYVDGKRLYVWPNLTLPLRQAIACDAMPSVSLNHAAAGDGSAWFDGGWSAIPTSLQQPQRAPVVLQQIRLYNVSLSDDRAPGWFWHQNSPFLAAVCFCTAQTIRRMPSTNTWLAENVFEL